MGGRSLSWTLQDHGWALCSVGDRRASVEVVVSYVTGGPEQFLEAVTNVVLGGGEARAEFEAEPTAYRWLFHRAGEHVDIRLLEITVRSLPDEVGVVIWASEQTVHTLARTVVRAFDQVTFDHGEEGYHVKWRRPFPHRELEVLRSAWRSWSAGSTP